MEAQQQQQGTLMAWLASCTTGELPLDCAGPQTVRNVTQTVCSVACAACVLIVSAGQISECHCKEQQHGKTN